MFLTSWYLANQINRSSNNIQNGLPTITWFCRISLSFCVVYGVQHWYKVTNELSIAFNFNNSSLSPVIYLSLCFTTLLFTQISYILSTSHCLAEMITKCCWPLMITIISIVVHLLIRLTVCHFPKYRYICEKTPYR